MATTNLLTDQNIYYITGIPKSIVNDQVIFQITQNSTDGEFIYGTSINLLINDSNIKNYLNNQVNLYIEKRSEQYFIISILNETELIDEEFLAKQDIYIIKGEVFSHQEEDNTVLFIVSQSSSTNEFQQDDMVCLDIGYSDITDYLNQEIEIYVEKTTNSDTYEYRVLCTTQNDLNDYSLLLAEQNIYLLTGMPLNTIDTNKISFKVKESLLDSEFLPENTYDFYIGYSDINLYISQEVEIYIEKNINSEEYTILEVKLLTNPNEEGYLTVKRRIKQKGYISTDWDPEFILLEREIGLELDTGQYKVGNGYTSWEHLPYFGITNANLAQKVDKIDGKGLSTNDYTTNEKNKLSNIETGAQKNQNAFSSINVNDLSTIAADSVTDTLTIKAGSNISISTNTSTDTITISGNPVIDNLTSTSTTSALSAYQGKVLNDKINDNSCFTYFYEIGFKTLSYNTETHVYTIPNWIDLHDSNGNLLYYFITTYTKNSSLIDTEPMLLVPLNTWVQTCYGSKSFENTYLNVKIDDQGKVYFKYYNSGNGAGDTGSYRQSFMAVKGQAFVG